MPFKPWEPILGILAPRPIAFPENDLHDFASPNGSTVRLLDPKIEKRARVAKSVAEYRKRKGKFTAPQVDLTARTDGGGPVARERAMPPLCSSKVAECWPTHSMGTEDKREGTEAEEMKYGKQPPTPLEETPSGLDADAQQANSHAIAPEGRGSTTLPGDNTTILPPSSKPRSLPEHDFLRTVLAPTESKFCEGLNLRTPPSSETHSQASSSLPKYLSKSAQVLPAERCTDLTKNFAPIREQEGHRVVQQGQAEHSPTIPRDSTARTDYNGPSPDMKKSSDLSALVQLALVASQKTEQRSARGREYDRGRRCGGGGNRYVNHQR